MKKKSSFILAIRDGEGYWFSRLDDDGEVFFVSPPETAKRYDNAAKALSERDELAQMCGDDSLTVRQVGPTAAVISRGDLGDEHRRAGVATILTGKEPMIPIEDISINMTSLPAIARRTSITLARIVIG